MSHKHPAANVWRDVRLVLSHTSWHRLFLDPPEVVPVDLRLGQPDRFLMLNGPAAFLAAVRLILLHECKRELWLQSSLTEGFVRVVKVDGKDVIFTTNRAMFSDDSFTRLAHYATYVFIFPEDWNFQYTYLAPWDTRTLVQLRRSAVTSRSSESRSEMRSLLSSNPAFAC